MPARGVLAVAVHLFEGPFRHPVVPLAEPAYAEVLRATAQLLFWHAPSAGETSIFRSPLGEKLLHNLGPCDRRFALQVKAVSRIPLGWASEPVFQCKHVGGIRFEQELYCCDAMPISDSQNGGSKAGFCLRVHLDCVHCA